MNTAGPPQGTSAAVEVYTFARLLPGALLGRRIDQIDPHALALWRTIYGTDESADVPNGFTAVLIMRAYLAIVTPRPPGNIHRSLTVRLHAPLCESQPLQQAVTCTAKQLRNGRRYVNFEVTGHDAQDRLVFSGDIDMVWAA